MAQAVSPHELGYWRGLCLLLARLEKDGIRHAIIALDDTQVAVDLERRRMEDLELKKYIVQT